MNRLRLFWAYHKEALVLSVVTCGMPIADWYRGQWKLVVFNQPLLSFLGTLVVLIALCFLTSAFTRFLGRRKT